MAMNTPAQWYNAVVRDCGLSRRTFQLSQGNIVVGTDSASLWNIFDAVPPLSFENYNPARGNLFSNNYGAIISSLKDAPLVGAAVGAWNAAGGYNSVKAFDNTIFNLLADLKKAPGAKVVMNLDNQSPDLSDAWTQAETGRPVQLFLSSAEYRAEFFPRPDAGSVVEVQFAHLLTFAAAPLAKIDPLNSGGLKDYKPWYNSAALKLALMDQGAWNNPDQWRVYFNPQEGSMLRCCTNLIVVDGVTSLTRAARSAAPLRGNSNTDAITTGFWPFSLPSGGVVKKPVATALRMTTALNGVPIEDSAGAVVIESKEGNPLILGVNVQPLREYLGAGTRTNPGSIIVRNEGWFYARFSCTYQKDGKLVSEKSENFDRGTSFSIELPGDASDISITIEEMYSLLPEKWSTILATNFAAPVNKSYEVYGTTLDANWREL
jgi:hypothetical protein